MCAGLRSITQDPMWYGAGYRNACIRPTCTNTRASIWPHVPAATVTARSLRKCKSCWCHRDNTGSTISSSKVPDRSYTARSHRPVTRPMARMVALRTGNHPWGRWAALYNTCPPHVLHNRTHVPAAWCSSSSGNCLQHSVCKAQNLPKRPKLHSRRCNTRHIPNQQHGATTADLQPVSAGQTLSDRCRSHCCTRTSWDVH